MHEHLITCIKLFIYFFILVLILILFFYIIFFIYLFILIIIFVTIQKNVDYIALIRKGDLVDIQPKES